jgi:methionyl-tRNA formyltransferase
VKEAPSPQLPLKLIFFGSSSFAIPSLKTLLLGPDTVELVVSVPPKPSGRGRQVMDVPVTIFARDAGLPLIEENKPNSQEIVDFIASFKPDLLVVAAYGALLGKELLQMGKTPPLNVHPSLLPRHRGPAPVNWAIVNGDRETGVSIMYLDEGMDTGPVLAQTKRPIDEKVSALELTQELATVGAKLLKDVLKSIKNGAQRPIPQNPEDATTNRLLLKKDGFIDFQKPAKQIVGLINGLDPWPCAQAKLKGKSVKFFTARALPGSFASGKVLGLSDSGELMIGAGDGQVLVSSLQMEGKRRIDASEFLNGYRPTYFTSMA